MTQVNIIFRHGTHPKMTHCTEKTSGFPEGMANNSGNQTEMVKCHQACGGQSFPGRYAEYHSG